MIAAHPRLTALVAACVLVWLGFVYLVVSPYLVTWRLAEAVEARDARTLMEHIDLPAVREQIKRQVLRGAMDAAGDDPEQAGGLALTSALLNVAAEGVLSETFVHAMLERALAERDPGAEVAYDTRYVSAQEFHVVFREPGTGEERGLVLRRDPWPWRVVGWTLEPGSG